MPWVGDAIVSVVGSAAASDAEEEDDEALEVNTAVLLMMFAGVTIGDKMITADFFLCEPN
eukprot:2923926-Amphidinium_carterae.1